MPKPLSPLTDDNNIQLDLLDELDETYDPYSGYALLAGTQEPPVLREDEMEI
jgi:hypothetical protein